VSASHQTWGLRCRERRAKGSKFCDVHAYRDTRAAMTMDPPTVPAKPTPLHVAAGEMVALLGLISHQLAAIHATLADVPTAPAGSAAELTVAADRQQEKSKPSLLSVPDLCERWQCGETAAREAYRYWGLRFIKLSGRAVRFQLSDVEAYEVARLHNSMEPVGRPIAKGRR
jgi:hypothetical protein